MKVKVKIFLILMVGFLVCGIATFKVVLKNSESGKNNAAEKSKPAMAAVNTNRQKVVKEEKPIIFAADEEARLSKFNFKFFTEKLNLLREDFSFGSDNKYSDLEGVTCFRGNNMRDGGSYGKVDVKEEKLYKLWETNIGAIDTWSGVGWNGQPSIVRWNDEAKEDMNLYSSKKQKSDFKEVLYAALDGYVHFLDLDDGSPTRDKLKIGAPVKGSLTVDPRGLPIVYVGQGIDRNGSKYVDFAYRMFSLTNFNLLYSIKGNDAFARRNWGAFDSTALIDKKKDYFFLCGENGVFYSGKLNTNFSGGTVSIKPEIEKYRYQARSTSKIGMENSIAIYQDYGFFSDNDGILQCINLKTLEPVWTREVNDDTDSTVVLEKQEDKLNLYTACEVDHQGNNGYSYVRKIDAASGKLLWEDKYRCALNNDINGGALATPVCGKEDINNLVIFNIARNPTANGGILVALDKTTGKEVWKLQFNNYCWSSPVALYSNSGKSYIVQCDSTGRTYLIEGITGRILDTIELGANVEGTPAAYNNKLVVGTRGCKIIGFEIK